MANTWTTLLDAVYPIGSIYQAYNSTSPASSFGGTWSQMKDRFLLGVGSTYTTVTTGGEAVHALSIKEMPSHSHNWGTNWGWDVSEGTASGEYHVPAQSYGNAMMNNSNFVGGGHPTTICRLIKRFIFGEELHNNALCVGGAA